MVIRLSTLSTFLPNEPIITSIHLRIHWIIYIFVKGSFQLKEEQEVCNPGRLKGSSQHRETMEKLKEAQEVSNPGRLKGSSQLSEIKEVSNHPRISEFGDKPYETDELNSSKNKGICGAK